MAACRTTRYRNEIAVATEPVDIGARPRDRGLDVGDVLRPAVMRRNAVVDRQAHPALLAPDGTSAHSPATAGRRAPTRRRARRSSPVRVRRAVPWVATRPATATGGRRSALRTGAGFGGVARIFNTGADRSGAGHSIARLAAGTIPRSAASMTALVDSRSCLRLTGWSAASHERARAREEVRHMAVAPDAHDGRSAKGLKVFPDNWQRRRCDAHRHQVIRRACAQKPTGALR